MILVIILLILIVLLIFDIFRYNKVKANAFSEYELKKAAEDEAKKLEYKDPFITCEYCGAKIDTHKDKCCSNCGAPYDLNEEWKERHSLKDSFIKDGTDAVNEKREKKALVWSNEILKRIRIEIIIIAGITVSILGMSVLGYYIYDYHKYRRNEDVNKGSYQNFEKADYRIIGDGIIYDKDGVTVTVTDIYEDADPVNVFENDGKQAAKIGFRVQNKLGKNINLVIKCSGANGIYCERSYIYSYDYFRKNADVTFYEELLYPKGSDLYELLFDYIEAGAMDYTYTGRLEEPVYIHTTAQETKDEISLNDKKLLYSNDDLDIFGMYDDDKYINGLKLYIRNKSGKDYTLDDYELRADGVNIKSEKYQNGLIPSGYIYESDRIRSYDIAPEDLKNKKIEIAVSFSDKKEHLHDFSTGFMDVSELYK